MSTQIWGLVALFLLQSFLMGEAMATAVAVEKAEASMPMTTWSPPEGNTTFLDGTSWCVAKPGVSQIDLQNALDWACGLGKADCRAIQKGGRCYQPDTLFSHASYAFNSYYQQNGNSDIACNFGGSATLTKRDPSYGKCDYSASRSTSSARSKWKKNGRHAWLKLVGGILMVMNLNLF
ncbi:glucan endo-1,3-beta-glucosidase 13-like [Cucurbita pepo subsp. pepo]|uniref:glucan endo-1,3-beta-glucosidase 13-like n=1 Tax=Cucurbita pepo subsp. pepo TaxID=3664 RepID=UPI000C9D66A0|nr:glucan endo-1,3-beta-glucosidase 13-like [Cucurbita pepo subsp. pepo]